MAIRAVRPSRWPGVSATAGQVDELGVVGSQQPLGHAPFADGAFQLLELLHLAQAVGSAAVRIDGVAVDHALQVGGTQLPKRQLGDGGQALPVFGVGSPLAFTHGGRQVGGNGFIGIPDRQGAQLAHPGVQRLQDGFLGSFPGGIAADAPAGQGDALDGLDREQGLPGFGALALQLADGAHPVGALAPPLGPGGKTAAFCHLG